MAENNEMKNIMFDSYDSYTDYIIELLRKNGGGAISKIRNELYINGLITCSEFGGFGLFTKEEYNIKYRNLKFKKILKC